MAARPTRAPRRGIRRGPREPVHTLLALLLTALAATAVVCGLATPAPASSMTAAGPVAMAGDVRTASAMRHGANDGCRQAAGPMAVSPDRDCDRTHCVSASGRPQPSCCDTPTPKGATSTPPAIAIPPEPGTAPGQPSATYEPHCPDTTASGPGPPDLHMLQLLRV
ncbi:hypothetical protein ABZ313_24295 [Streptomyces sp. NPDC006251]|uniref:hypothetical protein n=1 Tax=Streptomyces sp. NPDC006251 TaxID=3155718 RepID=UPI0033AE6918